MRVTNLFLVCILLIVIRLVNSQRGGGRSSGGGGFSSRSYSGIRGSSGSSSCTAKCGPDAICLQNCQRTGNIAATIIGSIFGLGCIGGCGAIGSRLSCFKGKICFCSKFKQLKRSYNQVDSQSMSIQQFRMKKDMLISLLNSSNSNNNFGFNQRDKKYIMKAHTVSVKDEDFICEINLTGTDQGSDPLGDWKATGYILCRNGQVFMWFYKEYNDKHFAGQTDQWQHLVYESTNFQNNHGIDGMWFYTGFEESDLYSGRWYLCDNNNRMY